MNLPQPVQSNFGQRLTQAREARGLSVEDAAKALRLRPSHVEALEESNLAKFPNAAYAKGFLVMYARFLDVDVSENAEAIDTTKAMRVADFQYLANRSSDEDKELKRAAQDSHYDFVVPERGGRSWMPLIVVGCVAAVAAVGFGVWMNLNRIGKTQDVAPAPVAPAQAIAPVPPGTAAKAVDGPVGDAPRPVVVAPPGSVAPTEGEIPRARPISPVANLAVDDAKALAELGSPVPPPAAAVETPAAPAVAPEEAGILLEPKRKTWVVIREGPGGVPVYEDFLYPNARPMRLPAGRYYIELKEADAVHIRKDGKRLTYQAPGLYVQ